MVSAPCTDRRRRNSETSRVLPTPESPPTSTTTGAPLCASLHACSSSASSRTRPTKWLLVSLGGMPEVSPCARGPWARPPEAGEAGLPFGDPADVGLVTGADSLGECGMHSALLLFESTL